MRCYSLFEYLHSNLLFIFGSGGFAKEVFFLIQEINKIGHSYDFGGFIDVNPSAEHIAIGNNSYEVFDETIFFESKLPDNVCFAIGLGSPAILSKIFKAYLSKYKFPNLIHPSVIGYFDAIELGEGNIITAGCIFTVDIKVGSLNIFNLNSTIGHDTIIGNCNVINPGVNISGGVNIGNNNLLGTNCCILQYYKVGDDNLIGAGAMVNINIEKHSVAVGVPAKIIKVNN